MNCTINRNSTQTTVYVEGEICVSQVREFRDALLSVIGDPMPIVVEVSGVKQIDTSAWQVLYAMKKTNGRLSLQGLSPGLREHLARAGIPIDCWSGKSTNESSVNGVSNG